MAKKPSSRIVEIIESRKNIDGSALLTADDCAEIARLTKSIDRRDQQLKKKYLGQKPVAKSAKRKARR